MVVAEFNGKEIFESHHSGNSTSIGSVTFSTDAKFVTAAGSGSDVANLKLHSMYSVKVRLPPYNAGWLGNETRTKDYSSSHTSRIGRSSSDNSMTLWNGWPVP